MSVSVALAMPVDGEQGEQALELADGAFARPFNEALVHQTVVAYLAGARQGTRAQKTRGEVRGGGRKPWRQKRMNRARAGSIRSPIWRGGGQTFAARPQDHSLKLNRKMYRGAMCCIFAELIRQHRIQAIPADRLSLPAPKTKLLAAKLAELGLGNVLLLTAELDRNLYLASRNLRGVEAIDVEALNPVALIGSDQVLATVDALKAVEERLA